MRVDQNIIAEAEALLRGWMGRYPELFASSKAHKVEIPWMSYRAALTFTPGGRLVDLGGGISLLNAALAALGMEVHVVDLLDEYFSASSLGDPCRRHFEFLAEQGVHFHKEDLTAFRFEKIFAPASIDVVASYHTLEHLHHSPKALMESALGALRPQGRLVIEVPNAVNLAKRLRVLIGRTNYQPWHGYYAKEVYYGHVREYCVDDLRELIAALGLESSSVSGRNWYGSLYHAIGFAPLARLADFALRASPALCGSLFLVGSNASRVRTASPVEEVRGADHSQAAAVFS